MHAFKVPIMPTVRDATPLILTLLQAVELTQGSFVIRQEESFVKFVYCQKSCWEVSIHQFEYKKRLGISKFNQFQQCQDYRTTNEYVLLR